MIPEIEPLKMLIDRVVVNVGTEISTTAPLMEKDPDKIVIEIPLAISFDTYTLIIYNRWTFVSDASNRVEKLRRQTLKKIQIVSDSLEFWFHTGDILKIDMSDDGFIGPEALELTGPDNFSVVWN